MSGINVNFDVVNQKGTPAFYSDIFANRPTYGYPGRVFISTDTGAIYEDTGTSWTLIADAGGGSTGTLQDVTTNGNSTTLPIVVQNMLLSKGAGTGSNNTGLGINALVFNTTGLSNTAIGSGSLLNNSTGNNNTANGSNTLTANTSGTFNVAIGSDSLLANLTGSNNTAIGTGAGSSITTGSNNTIIGAYAGTTTLANNIVLSDGSANVRLFSNATGLIGINQAVGTPSAQLDIHTTQTYGLAVNGTTTNNAYLGFANAGTYKWRIGNRYNAGANSLDFYNVGTSTTALSFDVTNSNAVFNGTITGSSLIKSGGTSAQILAADGSVITAGTNITISGGTIASSGGGSITLSAIGSTANANGATITGSALNLQPASASFGGVVTTGTQTFAGNKTFSGIVAGQVNDNIFGVSTSGGYALTLNTANGGNALKIIGRNNTPFDEAAIVFTKFDGTTTQAFIQATNSNLVFSTSSEVMRITSTNNLLVGTSTNIASAIIVASSTTKGFLPPVMTTTQKNAISSPATGLVVFDSTLGKLCVFSTTWQTITSA
jgi:hypothetical protein